MAFKTLQLRRDTAANWTANDPTLAAGEIGVETDTLKFKIGDGSTAWTSLSYAAVLPGSDFEEAAQDAVGGILTDTSSIDFTYDDNANTITADVLPGGVDHNSLSNYDANEHVDHTGVTITAGTGLSGGGDISSDRTIDLDITELNAETSVDGTADYVVIYDTGGTTHKKVLVDDLLDSFDCGASA